MMQTVLFLTVIVLSGLFGSRGTDAIARTGAEQHAAGADRSMSDLPLYETETLALTKMWALDAADEDDIVVGVVAGAEFDSLGTLYLLDGQLLAVKVLSPSGDLVRTMGGRGEGPGLFMSAVALNRFANGDIGVLQPMPAKMVVYSAGGEPLRDIGFDVAGYEFPRVLSCRTGHGGLLVAGYAVATDPTNQVIHRNYFLLNYVRPDRPGRLLMSKQVTWSYTGSRPFLESDLDFVTRRMVVDKEGLIYVAEDRDEYRIRVLTAEGAEVATFGRSLEPCQRTDQHRALARYFFGGVTKRFSPDRERRLCPNEPAILRMALLSNRTLWVLPGCGHKGNREPGYPDFDVFSTDGVYLRTVKVPLDGDPMVDALVLSQYGYALMITNLTENMLAARRTRGPRAASGQEVGLRITCYRIENLPELCADNASR